MITLLDGPMGTELAARGVMTELPLWSAAAIDAAPEVIAAIHRDYADAGATVHTANTFPNEATDGGRKMGTAGTPGRRVRASRGPAVTPPRRQHRTAGGLLSTRSITGQQLA